MRLAIVVVLVLATPAIANPDDTPPGSIIFARGSSLIRVDAKGKGETEIATLTDAKQRVRSLRTDAAGKILLADVAGTWAWMPLDGSAKTLAPLPCTDGPAQLEEDGSHVICRSKQGAIDVNLAIDKSWPVDVPVARIFGSGADRKFVWAASDGIWTAPPSPSPHANATKVAPDAPLRGFLPSPDGSRALGVYAAEVYTDVHHKKPAEVLMGFALDGVGAQRKAIKSGVGVEWSHDGAWVLVQDGANACLMRATGGEYKCWRGYTAASISPDGKFALVLGNRDGSKRQTPAGKVGKAADPDAETDDDMNVADVAVPPPTGPLSLYRARLEGSAFTETPALVAKIVDGAAVWVPAP
jgi:hypothetical protein